MATRMNSRGTVVGYVNIGYGAGCRAVVWHGTAPMDLGVLEIWRGRWASAWGVNESDWRRPGFRPARCGVRGGVFRATASSRNSARSAGFEDKRRDQQPELVVGGPDVRRKVTSCTASSPSTAS